MICIRLFTISFRFIYLFYQKIKKNQARYLLPHSAGLIGSRGVGDAPRVPTILITCCTVCYGIMLYYTAKEGYYPLVYRGVTMNTPYVGMYQANFFFGQSKLVRVT